MRLIPAQVDPLTRLGVLRIALEDGGRVVRRGGALPILGEE